MITLSQAVDHFSGIVGTAIHFKAFEVEPDRAVSFVSATVQVLVVIAGLYYAALSVVISAGYRDANGPLYDILTTITPGQQYLRDTMRLAVFGAIILALEALRVSVGPWTLSVFTILLLLDLAAFVRVGTLAFELFNPRRLIPLVAERIATELQAVAAASRRQAAAEVLDTHRRRARREIDALTDVAALCEKDGGATETIITSICQLLLDYSAIVPHLSVESKWFEHLFEHRSWFEADPMEVTLALSTATELRPNDVPDRTWFERALLPVLLKALDITLKRARLLEVQSATAALSQTVQELSSVYAVSTVELIVPELVKCLLAQTDKDYPTVVSFRRGSSAGILLTTSTLGLTLSVKDFRLDFLSYVAGHDRVDDALPMPIEVNTLLDNFRAGWRLEERAEGKRITSPVYVAEICLNEYFVRVVEQTERYLKLLQREIHGMITISPSEASYAQVGALLETLGSIDKFETLTEQVQSFRERSMPDASALSASAWSQEALDKVIGEAEPLRADVLSHLMAVSTMRAGDVLDSSLPQFAEAAFQHGADIFYGSLVQGKHDICVALAPTLFSLGRALVASAISGGRIETVAAWIALDICELAGYALLYDEINATETAPEVLAAFASSCNSDAAVMLVLIQLADVARSPHWIGPRLLVRQRWEMTILEAMRAMTGITRTVTRYGEDELNFGSTLLNIVYDDHSLSYDAFIVFCALYAFQNVSTSLSTVDDDVARLRSRLAEANEEVTNEQDP